MLGRVLLASVVMAFLGCSDDSLLPTEIAGLYPLQSINGDPLPWSIGFASSKILDITAGSAVLDADSSCNISFTIQTVEFDVFGQLGSPTAMTESDSCTFVLDGRGLTLIYETGDADSGSISGSQITLFRGDDVFVFVE